MYYNYFPVAINIDLSTPNQPRAVNSPSLSIIDITKINFFVIIVSLKFEQYVFLWDRSFLVF